MGEEMKLVVPGSNSVKSSGSNTGKRTTSSNTRKTVNVNNGKSTIPSVNLDTDQSVGQIVGNKIPQVKQETNSGERHIVDISQMKSDKPKEIPGVTVLESPQAEILKPGGIFDKYVEKKTAEFHERMAEEEAKAEIEASESDEQTEYVLNDESETTTIDEEEEAILAEQGNNTNDVKNVSVTSVSRGDERVPEVAVEDPKPFYTSTGNIPDYDYPEDYDLPENDFLDKVVEETDENEDCEEEVELEDIYEEEEETTPVVTEKEEVVEESDDESHSDERSGEVAATKVAITIGSEESEEFELEVDNSGVPTDDERLEEFKSEISSKIKPKAQSLGLGGFTIAGKATSSNKIFEINEASAGKWVLPATGITIQMREISGQKIEYLRENMDMNPTSARNRLKLLYDHIITPKPQSFEAWSKTIAYADYDHLFMPIYMAAFSDSNFMPQTCEIEKGKVARMGTGCGKMFLSNNIPIMDCVKFKDAESKEKFWNLYDSDRSNSEGLWVGEAVRVSKKFAIVFREPTLYSVLFEAGSYGRDFASKYENVIAFMPYIEKIYWLDEKNMKMVEVSYKTYENNASKTAKSKAIKYSQVFDTLKTDEYTNVVSIISAINDRYDWFTYQIPEMTCPECGRTIPAEEITASGLVFTRHRLGILANTSIK